MIDPNHKAAALPGTFGAGLSWFLHWIGEYDWAHVAGFITCLLVASQLFWGWDKWRKSK